MVFHLFSRFVYVFYIFNYSFRTNIRNLVTGLNGIAENLSFIKSTQNLIPNIYYRQNPNQSEPLLPNVNSISLANFLSLDKCTVFTIHGHNDSAGGNFNAFAIRGGLFRISK